MLNIPHRLNGSRRRANPLFLYILERFEYYSSTICPAWSGAVLWEQRMDTTTDQSGSETQPDGCNGHCGKCPTQRDDKLVPDSVPEGGIEGIRLVSFAALAFLLPPVLAIVAAIVFGGSTNRTVIAAMGGLVVGVGVAKLGSLALTKKEDTESSI